MAKKEGKPRSAGPVLLVGAGDRPREVGACLAALHALYGSADGGAEGAGDLAPYRPAGLEDLEELLSQKPPSGLLLLDCERVPGEDIGFVRRFLERHGGWKLLIVGDDERDPRARGLCRLPRARWLAWPPNLEELARLARPRESGGRVASPGAPSGPGTTRDEEAATASRAAPSSTPARATEAGPFDVGALLEELLAGASLEGDGSPRCLYRCDHTLLLERERAPVAEALSGLLLLARRCAGEKGVVSAQADPAPASGDPEDTVRLRIDFPRGALGPDDLPGLLEKPFEGEPELAEEVARAGRGAARLRREGARLTLSSQRPDRLRFEVHLASVPLSAAAAAAPVEPVPGEAAAADTPEGADGEPEPVHAGKARDPFA